MHPPLYPLFGGITLANLLWATLLCVGFVGVLFLGARFLPGPIRLGNPLADGTRKPYKLTGLTLFLGTTVLVTVSTLLFHLSLAPLVSLFWPLFLVANAAAFAWTGVLTVQGRRKRERAGGSETSKRSVLQDLWLGSELNPTWLGVDLKVFAYQPSLIGLALLNAAFAYQQYATYGRLSTQMILYQVFWWVYLLSHYWYEESMLTMWDIIAENFGLMLVWGDLVLVPFFYSIGGWFLIDQVGSWPVPAILGLALLYLFGLSLFRGANAQKHRFKQNAHARIWGKPAQALEGKLLVSGWWGIGRKLNYSGETCVYLSIALTTGFGSIVPYLLPLWLFLLLVQRAARDDQRCRSKYGPLWDAYCARARFRMIPFLY